MIKRILEYFGYIPKQRLMDEVYLLNLDIDRLNQKIEFEQKTSNLAIQRLKSEQKKLKEFKEIAYKDSMEFLNKISLLEAELESKTSEVKELKLLNKELKRKNTRLLNKQKEFKEKIVLLESDNLKYKSESVFWKLYSQKAVDKLEYICFGSVLPQVVRSIDLSKYQTPSDKVQYEWYETKDGIGVRANEK